MNLNFICGDFNSEGGKDSRYMRKVFNALVRKLEIKEGTLLANGGDLKRLMELKEITKSGDVNFWFPNVPNSERKTLEEIKKYNPHSLLISSKRNDNEKYSFMHLVARALKSKSNLVLEVRKNDSGCIEARIFDPLGNVFLDFTTSVITVGRVLAKRLSELLKVKRYRSIRTGNIVIQPKYKLSNFFTLVKEYADIFHEKIHAIDQSRFLGNASFRCESGFPSFRQDRYIFVSRRNLDKRKISRENFIAVDLGTECVKYYGDVEHKPSVDTPIQLQLYAYYHNINYMLHSHVYIKDAPFTKEILPCGAVQEFNQIIREVPDDEKRQISINLRGHGSIRMSSDLDGMLNIPYVARNIPEIHEAYKERFNDEK